MKNKENYSDKLMTVREKLQKSHGKAYWRSLEELAGSEEFQEMLQNEFSSSPLDWGNSLSRRNFLKFTGASMALAGMTACTKQPLEKIHPYVDTPEDIIPGVPLNFATAFIHRGYASGVLVESHEGHPTKVEGNPQHPASLGATDIFAQASILNLYDPERAKVVKNLGRISTWDAFIDALKTHLAKQAAGQGSGLRILTETITSPTIANQIHSVLDKFPKAKWHQFEPATRDNVKKGAKLAFGKIYDTQYNFKKADIVLSLDADFFSNMPGHLSYTRQFTERRKKTDNMNRLYAVESTPTLTGAMADHRLALRAGEVVAFAALVAKELGVAEQMGLSIKGDTSSLQQYQKWIRALAGDLNRHRGSCLVVAGEYQSPEVHLLAHILNAALNNVGHTVFYTAPVEANPVMQVDSLTELVQEMQAGAVDMLIMLGGNPVFNAPADLNFFDALDKVDFRVHLCPEDNETSLYSHWLIPQSHYLEMWSDALAYDGTASILQPLIAPLYGTKNSHDLLAVLLDESGKASYDIVKEFWKSKHKQSGFETFWETSVHDGFVANTTFKPRKVALDVQVRKIEIPSSEKLDVNFRPDPNIDDGRFVNNGWLQELPKPLTKLTWDNAVLMSPATANSLHVANEEMLELDAGYGSVKLPVWIMPGHADNTVTVHFGYGRKICGKVGLGSGSDVYPLRVSESLWNAGNIAIKKTDETRRLASTQEHSSMENRHLVRSAPLTEYLEHPEMFQEMEEVPPPEMSLYPPWDYSGVAWGLVVDLNSCVGCNACTVACQSENNIPVVGKEEVLNGREMHWIRLDRYYEGEPENPATHHQPVMCMHCEDAPCEVVCPVAATTHSPEGLNEMIYNRCVGTRYCSNNCPYKVRRFNFYKYADFDTDVLKLMNNPDVSVRSRGVMEKCSYCVQRINAVRIEAEKEDREIRDGEIVTACQQVCPADAIVFGNINDKESRVAKLKADSRNYGLLTEIGTRPRTSYIAKIKNPNPEIEQG